jgi:hypothetical protein
MDMHGTRNVSMKAIFFNIRRLLQTAIRGNYAEEAARLIDTYTKYNRRVTPEMLNDKTYSLDNYNEWQRVKDDYVALSLDA